jgi:hypothetical protein
LSSDEELLGGWLDRALLSVPQELSARIRASLPSGWQNVSLADGVAILTQAANTELRELLARGCDARWAAPGLLTVDALVTYACELLARSGTDIISGTSEILDTIIRTMPQADSRA